MTARDKEPSSFATLSVEVEGVKADVRDLKDGLVGLRVSVDETMARFITETRATLSGLSDKMSQGRITPWATLIGAMTLGMGVLGAFGHQAISPLVSEIKSIREQMVPREEITFRSEAANRRLTELGNEIRQIQVRRYEELIREIARLQAENLAARAANVADRDARIGGTVRRLERIEGNPSPINPARPSSP